HRCGVAPGAAAVDLAQAVEQAPSLRFEGLQAYQGSLQHIEDPVERRQKAEAAARATRTTVEMLAAVEIECRTVGGAGTGSFAMDASLGVINELQCGSYIFMDAHYDRVEEEGGGRPGGMENSLFVVTGVMSTAIAGRPVCDAGLKALAVDSGLPRVDKAGIQYVRASDEHGVLDDPERVLDVGDRLLLVAGHCDPTCNLHDWYVAVRGKQVEAVWPVTARGKLF
ncbi:MAG: Metal-activated pyridoxal enzyme, partial [Microvirga sp.]|nr:Metal-activated pyridoxal enzyme [Microvirga sp.]